MKSSGSIGCWRAELEDDELLLDNEEELLDEVEDDEKLSLSPFPPPSPSSLLSFSFSFLITDIKELLDKLDGKKGFDSFPLNTMYGVETVDDDSGVADGKLLVVVLELEEDELLKLEELGMGNCVALMLPKNSKDNDSAGRLNN
jgi:hypothetical protein